MAPFFTIGSLLMSIIFLASGAGKIMQPAGVAAAIKGSKFYPLANSLGVPLSDGDNLKYFTMFLGVVMVIAASMFVFNIVRPLAALILTFLVGTFTLFIHVNLDDIAATPQDQIIHVLKNLAVMGGLLMGGFGGRVRVKKNGKAKRE